MPRSWEGTGTARNRIPLVAGDYSPVLDHEQPPGSLSGPVHAHSQLGLGDALAEPRLHTGPLSQGANHFEELGVNALFFSPSLFFPPRPFPAQQPTGSKRPFAVVKATRYHKDGAVKWQQPRALLSISATSLARPRCHCQPCCSAGARGGQARSQPHGPCPGACKPDAPSSPQRCYPTPVTSLHQRHPLLSCNKPSMSLLPVEAVLGIQWGARCIPQTCCMDSPGPQQALWSLW